MQAFVKTWMMKMRRNSQANSISWFEFIGHLTIIRGKTQEREKGKKSESVAAGSKSTGGISVIYTNANGLLVLYYDY